MFPDLRNCSSPRCLSIQKNDLYGKNRIPQQTDINTPWKNRQAPDNGFLQLFMRSLWNAEIYGRKV